MIYQESVLTAVFIENFLGAITYFSPFLASAYSTSSITLDLGVIITSIFQENLKLIGVEKLAQSHRARLQGKWDSYSGSQDQEPHVGS